MNMPLLQTKFHIPEPDPDGEIRRSGLLTRMAGAPEGRLTLVRAPAGFGKTTFVSQWLFSLKDAGRAAWVSLESRDNSPRQFWTYVTAGINRLFPGVCDPALQLLEAGIQPGSEEFLITLVNSLAGLEGRCLLVLDDFHLITDTAVLDGMNFLIDHPMDTLGIVLATRTQPPMGLSRLRTAGRLREITETDLAFSPEEILAYVRQFARTKISDDDVAALARKTEGWAAGLKLALLSRDQTPDLSVDGLSGDAGFIREYLMEEVWAKLPGEMQAATARISILDRFNPGVCRALCKDVLENADLDQDIADPLEFIRQRRLFLISLDDAGCWFRFHHLFQDFLVRQLERTDDPGVYHGLAAQWFEANDYLEEAFSHAVAAGNQALAAKVLAARAPVLYGEGADDALVPLFELLSPDEIKKQPMLACYYYSIEVYNGNFDCLAELAACRIHAGSREELDTLDGFLMALEGYSSIYREGALAEAVAVFTRARELVPAFHGTMHRMLEFMISFCHRYTGNVGQARAYARPRACDSLLMSAFNAINRVGLELESGNLKLARELADQEVLAVESAFRDAIPAIYGFLFIYRGVIAREADELDTARHFFSKGIDIVRNARFLELIIISFGEYADFLLEIENFDDAHDIIGQAIGLAGQSPWIQDLMSSIKMRIWLREGKPHLVADWARTYYVGPDLEIPFHKSQEYLTLTRYFLAVREWEKAGRILDYFIPRDEKSRQQNQRLLHCCLLKAKLLHLTGQNSRAQALFSKAVALNRNQGFIRLFVTELPGMEELVRTVLDEPDIPNDLASALGAALKPGAPAPPARQVLVHDMSEEFNTREIDILNLFRKGRSNQEAADELCLSVNTIRWYAGRIFSKLCVKRRGQAVSRAVDLGLI